MGPERIAEDNEELKCRLPESELMAFNNLQRVTGLDADEWLFSGVTVVVADVPPVESEKRDGGIGYDGESNDGSFGGATGIPLFLPRFAFFDLNGAESADALRDPR